MQPATAEHPKPRRIEFVASTPPGRVWIAVFSAVALAPSFGYLALVFAAAIGLAAFRQTWRRPTVSALAVIVCLFEFVPRWQAFALATCWIALLLVWTQFARKGRPVPWLHAISALLLASICIARGSSFLGGVTAGTLCALVPELLWRSHYWIKWRLRQTGQPPVWNNLFAALPFFAAGGVPFGKGPAYLAKHEAAGPGELASSQIEGVKLLLLAGLWRVADAALQWTLWGIPTSWLPAWTPFQRAPLPSMELLMRIPASFALWQRWAALYGELFHAVLALAWFGHTIVAAFCLLGFHIPRNTQSPLTATTIVDFWGRYYFYFKELLMDFFFFPVFLKTSRLTVLWRTMLATAAAAFLGNLYYHAVLYSPILASGDTRGFRSLLSARVVYCALLAAGLCASMARALKRPQARTASPLRRAAQVFVVATFFALLHVWNYGGPPIPMERRLHLWKTLVGVETNLRAIQLQSGR
jgi:hypothetical protein